MLKSMSQTWITKKLEKYFEIEQKWQYLYKNCSGSSKDVILKK